MSFSSSQSKDEVGVLSPSVSKGGAGGALCLAVVATVRVTPERAAAKVGVTVASSSIDVA